MVIASNAIRGFAAVAATSVTATFAYFASVPTVLSHLRIVYLFLWRKLYN